MLFCIVLSICIVHLYVHTLTLLVLKLCLISFSLLFQQTAVSQNDFVSVLKKWSSSLTITALNLVLPLIFEVLTEFEDWSPRLEVALILWR